MKISRRQTFLNGGGKLTCSLDDFLASLLVLPDSEEARKMTAISGRTCTAVYSKCSPIGLFVKMLVESSQWWFLLAK